MKLLLIFALFSTQFAQAASSVNAALFTLYTTSVSTSVQVLPANSSRRALIIQNNGSSSIYVKVGSTIASTEGLVVAAGGNYEPVIPPTGSIWMKASTGTQSVTTYEGN